MIFRKPYAILIKNFKLIHTIITICMCFLIYRTYALNVFFNEYMKTTMLPLGKGASQELFNIYSFILPIVLIVFSVVLLITMFKKEKPKMLYVFSIVVFVAVFGLYNYINSTIIYLEQNILTARSIRLCADLTVLTLLVQLILVVLSLIRSIGFDIKKFDFKKDLMDMDILDEDNEEFEVSFDVDENAFKRAINKKIRVFKYAYLENKFLFRIGALLAIVYLTYSLYQNSNLNARLLKENGDAFFSETFTLRVTSSYITKKDYKDKEITSGNYVAVKLDAKTVKSGSKLNLARMQLKVGNTVYYPVEKGLVDELFDLGKVYNNDPITKDTQSFLIVYDLPLGVNAKNADFRYITSVNGSEIEYAVVDLNPKMLDEKVKSDDAKVKSNIVLNEAVLGKTSINISSFEIGKEFVQSYKYCLTESECYPSVEYIKPSLNTRYDKALIKVEGKLIPDDNYSIRGMNSILFIINKFGTIVYKMNGNTYKMKGNISWVESSKYKKNDIFYIEANQAILNSDYVYMLIQIRDKEYKYEIKKDKK